ncbi:hypothetical protein ACHAWF_016043, partial [Thalassiosira exigua]
EKDAGSEAAGDSGGRGKKRRRSAGGKDRTPKQEDPSDDDGGGDDVPNPEDRRRRRDRRRLPSSTPPSPSERRGRRPEKRRVVPWISVAVLLTVLFFFRSFAAPFFDPLGEPRKATYFSFLAVLYVWLASVTTLTVLPQFSTKYNVTIAAALFFYMTSVSGCALLAGRFVVRGAYYASLIWRAGGEGGGGRQRGTRGIAAAAPHWLFGFRMGAGTGGDRARGTPRERRFPVLVAFHRPFRTVCKSSVFLSAALCLLFSHCWSRSLSAFGLSREDGASFVCRGIFLPTMLIGAPALPSPSVETDCHADCACAPERSIWILWAAGIIVLHATYAMNEFSGKHHADFPAGAAGRAGASKSDGSFDVDLGIQAADSDDMDAGAEGDYEDQPDELFGIARGPGEGEGADTWQSISATIQKFKKTKPEQPEGQRRMVSWYSNIIFSTGFDILLSFKVFLGRFDARKMQVALLKDGKPNDSADPEGVFDFTQCETYNHHDAHEDEFWFDFVSDCGDGFDSSYQVSRLLAQPTLDVITPSSRLSGQRGRRTLPRGKLLVNGGDLAYPDPTPASYERRFFRTFEDAMPPPPSFRKEHISIRKPALPVKGWKVDAEAKAEEGNSELSRYPGPCTFLVPGNHDWFDGLSTFTRYILSRDWLGGWLMPQRTSYFALKLPKGWWLLGFDLALDDDINIEQFQFFAQVATSMKPDDSVIIVSHVPHWVLNEYENHSKDSERETNLSELVRTHLRGRVKMRLAGDLHHYTRHMPVNTSGHTDVKTSEKPVLIVCGGGGAFLHPTHCFQEQIKVGEEKQVYARVCAYPSAKVSRHLSWLNLWQFRWRNWRFDILWAITHFGVASSLFPLCGVYGKSSSCRIETEADSFPHTCFCSASIFRRLLRIQPFSQYWLLAAVGVSTSDVAFFPHFRVGAHVSALHYDHFWHCVHLH